MTLKRARKVRLRQRLKEVGYDVIDHHMSFAQLEVMVVIMLNRLAKNEQVSTTVMCGRIVALREKFKHSARVRVNDIGEDIVVGCGAGYTQECEETPVIKPNLPNNPEK